MIECFFDCSSPWTYLGFHNLQTLSRELAVPVRWRPILVGGVFNAVNPSVYASREQPVPAKQAYMLKDLRDWAHEADLHIVMPPRIFPVNSVQAMRACVWLESQGRMEPFARAVFEAYWSREEDIADPAVLDHLALACDIDPDALRAGIASPGVRQQLRANTDELIRRGGFGSPTFFVGEDMYFGNDRLTLVRAAVLRSRAVDGPAR